MITRDEVLDVQRMLVFYGFGPLKFDGLLGPKTEASCRAFIALPRTWTEPDPRSRNCLLTLHPLAAEVAAAHLETIRDGRLAPIVRIISGRRSWPEQARLYAQGRTEPGPRVTNARAGQSFHNYGLGWDIALFDADGRYMTGRLAREREAYREAAAVRRNDVTWGGLFTNSDPPHYHYAFGKKIADLRKMWMAGKPLVVTA